MEQENKISFTKRRKVLVQLFYRYLLMEKGSITIKQDLLDETQAKLDNETLTIAEQIADNLSKLIKRITPLLGENWTWERIPALIKSILVVGAFEITNTNTPKAVTINELTELAKELGLDNDYKFINAILDKLDKM